MATDVMELARELVDLAGPPLHPLYGAHAIRDGDKIARHLLAMQAVVDAARCIRHWHDSGSDSAGMMLSAEHVRALGVTLDALDKLKEGR